MPQQPVTFKSPLKGVVRATAFTDQPNDATIDALNVLPFDTAGRLRLRQRTGTTKQFVSAIGSGAPVKALLQVTTLATAAGGTIYTDPFTYSNGNLFAVDGGAWSIFDSSSFTLQVVSNRVSLTGTNSGFSQASRTSGTPLGSNVTLSISFRLPADFYTSSTGHRVQLQYQIDGVGSLLYAQVFKSGSQALLEIVNENTSASVDSGLLSLLTATDYLLTLTITGGTATASLDFGPTSVSTAVSSSPSSLLYAFQLVRGTSTNTISVDNFSITAPTSGSVRANNLIAVSGGNIYQGDLNSITLATSGSGALNSGVIPSVAFADAKAYFVDGTTIKVLDIKTATVSSFTATAGSAPTNCTLAATYRDRLVLAAPPTTPQNFFLSRVGTQTDFDYGQEDPAAAFAGNASEFGRIGEPITALMPFSDDLMFIGGDHNLWAIRGDPADGGSIDMVSDAIGVLSNTAWTKTPEGTLFFIGTGGLFRVDQQGGVPVNVSNERWEQFFRQIDRGSNYITMDWDRDRQGMYIFIVPTDGFTQGTGIFYDSRNGGFWPIEFPVANGPVSTVLYDGDGPDDRFIFLGGTDGFIRRLDEASASDDSVAISSYVYLGPFTTSDMVELVIDSVDVTLGEPPTGFTDSDWNVQLDLVTGQTVERAFNSPRYTRTRVFTTPRRQPKWLTRIRGAVAFLKLSNSTVNKTWVFEKAVAMVSQSGVVRRR